MNPVELRRRAAELRENIRKLVATAEAENRELNDDEQALMADYQKQSESLVRRAELVERVEADAAESRQSAGRTAEPIAGRIEAGETEADRRNSFSDWLQCVDAVSDRRTPRDVAERSHDLLENMYRSAFRKWDDPSRPREVRNLAMNSGTTGGFTMPEGFYAKLLQVSAPMSLVRPRATVIPMGAETVKIPSLDQTTAQTAGTPPYYGGVVLSWSGESASISSTQPGFRQTELHLHELTGYCPVGRTLLQKSAISLEPLIYTLFGGAVAFAEDYAFLRGNGVGKPIGLLAPEVAARIKTTDRGSSTAITFANIVDVWTSVLGESQNVGVWVVSKAVEPQILKMTGTASSVFFPTGVYQSNGETINAGPGGGAAGVMLFMRPVIVSTKLPGADVDGDVNFFDFSKYLVGDGGPPEVASSDDYLFRTNERAFRIVHRVGGAPWLNSYITLEDATTTVSPFVSLGIH